jgi:hypothetical protein
MTGRCPHCGAAGDFAGGVHMPARKAAIFRSIKAAGDIGISSRELAIGLYGDDRKPRLETVKAHVGQINDLLEETSFKIVSIDRRCVLTRVSREFPHAGKTPPVVSGKV